MAGSIRDKEPVARSIPIGWHHQFVGIPFLDGGRTLQGCDCWGLVRLIYAMVPGIVLPSYGDVSAADLINVARSIGSQYDKEPWAEVSKPQPLDVVVMRFQGSRVVGHVGVAINSRQFIHTEKTFDAALVPFDHWTVRQRIHCIRRHRGIIK